MMTCPKCGHENVEGTVNCAQCHVNLAYALEHTEEFRQPEPMPQESPKPMNKWEYCELAITIGGPISGTQGRLITFQENGKHIKSEGGDYGAMLARLGNQGWEMVGSSARIEGGFTNKHLINYIFKRKN